MGLEEGVGLEEEGVVVVEEGVGLEGAALVEVEEGRLDGIVCFFVWGGLGGGW